jgi:protein SCO1/2
MYSSSDPETQKRIRKTFAIIGVIVVIFLVLFFNRMMQPRALTNSQMLINGLSMFEQPRAFEDFSFIDHNGEVFDQDNLNGKWTMIFPGFTFCPDICPVTMSILGQAWDLIDDKPKEDLQVVMMTVDPHRDTPERLAQYVPYFNENFVGITADISKTLWVAKQLNIAMTVVNPDTAGDFYSISHSGNIVLINPRGHYAGYFKPPFDVGRIKLTYQSAWGQF